MVFRHGVEGYLGETLSHSFVHSFIHSFNKIHTMCCAKRRSLWGFLITERHPRGRAKITTAPASKGLGSEQTGLNSKGNEVQVVRKERSPLVLAGECGVHRRR